VHGQPWPHTNRIHLLCRRYSEAEALKLQIQELERMKTELSAAPVVVEAATRQRKEDPGTWLACLTVVRDMLATTRLSLTNPHLGALVGSLVPPPSLPLPKTPRPPRLYVPVIYFTGLWLLGNLLPFVVVANFWSSPWHLLSSPLSRSTHAYIPS